MNGKNVDGPARSRGGRRAGRDGSAAPGADRAGRRRPDRDAGTRSGRARQERLRLELDRPHRPVRPRRPSPAPRLSRPDLRGGSIMRNKHLLGAAAAAALFLVPARGLGAGQRRQRRAAAATRAASPRPRRPIWSWAIRSAPAAPPMPRQRAPSRRVHRPDRLQGRSRLSMGHIGSDRPDRPAPALPPPRQLSLPPRAGGPSVAPADECAIVAAGPAPIRTSSDARHGSPPGPCRESGVHIGYRRGTVSKPVILKGVGGLGPARARGVAYNGDVCVQHGGGARRLSL